MNNFCIYKSNCIYPFTIIVGYIGYILYNKYKIEYDGAGDYDVGGDGYDDWTADDDSDNDKKNYIAGGISDIDIKCGDLNSTVGDFLKKYHDYEDKFVIIGGTQQVVSGIKYKCEIEYKDTEKIMVSFIHRPWLEDDKIFTNLDD
jgi:hypothetical protein